MAQAGDSEDALRAARRVLAARDADLADADRALAAALADAHAVAVDSKGRLDAIASEVEATVMQPKDSAAGAREVSRNLVVHNREISAVVCRATDDMARKTIALRALIERYRSQSPD